MKVTEYAKILADRINQEHYVLHIMNKVYALGVKNIKKIKEDNEAEILNYLKSKTDTLINSLNEEKDVNKQNNNLGKIEAYSDVMLFISELIKNKQK